MSNPKRSRQKGQPSISFKAYAAQNCGKVTTRLPFLTKQQIRAKLLDSWRRCCRGGGSKWTIKRSPKSSQEAESTEPRENSDTEDTSDSRKKQRNEVQEIGVVSGLFNSRLKDISETNPKGSEALVTRLLPSEESEGSSNFHAMFSDQEDIFL